MHSDPERADEFLSSRASVAMVATSNAPEERQTLLDPDPAPTRSSGRGSFARYATAGTFLAGLAVAAVTTSGTADASAITRVKLGDASADLPGHPQHAEAVGHRLTPEAVRWWHQHHPKQPVLGDFDEMGTGKRASVNTDEKSGAHDEDVASTGKRETDALSSSSSSSKKYVASADDSIGDISIGEAGADKSQDMFSHLFGDGNPALEVRVPSAAVLHDPAEAKEDEALVSEFGAADEIIKTHDHSHKKHSHEKHSHEKHSHEKHSHEKHSHKKHFHEKHSHEKHSHEKHSPRNTPTRNTPTRNTPTRSTPTRNTLTRNTPRARSTFPTPDLRTHPRSPRSSIRVNLILRMPLPARTTWRNGSPSSGRSSRPNTRRR